MNKKLFFLCSLFLLGSSNFGFALNEEHKAVKLNISKNLEPGLYQVLDDEDLLMLIMSGQAPLLINKNNISDKYYEIIMKREKTFIGAIKDSKWLMTLCIAIAFGSVLDLSKSVGLLPSSTVEK